MKKLWLFIFIIGGVAQLKAQQLTVPPLTDKKADKVNYQPFMNNSGNNILIPAPAMPKITKPLITIPGINNLATPQTIDNMPIAKLRSADKMPVIKTGEPNTHYTMLIKRYGTANSDSLLKVVRP